jgi:hypothetical protein
MLVIVRVDDAAFPPEDDPTDNPLPPGASRGFPRRDGIAMNAPRVQTATTTESCWTYPSWTPCIDLLVVYTAAANAAEEDINGLIQTAVLETNQAYVNSITNNVRLELVVAHVAQVDYNEAGHTWQQHIDLLKGASDGIMDNVHALRNQHLADVVVLIVEGPSNLCGKAAGILAEPFAVVRHDCALQPRFTFGHEIGHVQGARHDRFVDPTSTPFPYGHGYVDPNFTWRTIMAYDSACVVAGHSCPRVQFFSTPWVSHPQTGQPLGTSTYEYDASVIDRTKFDVRDYRTLGGVNFHLSNGQVTGSPPHLTWDAKPEADWFFIYKCRLDESSCGPSDFYQFESVTTTDFDDLEERLTDQVFPCSQSQVDYIVTALNRTGESGYLNFQPVCVETVGLIGSRSMRGQRE